MQLQSEALASGADLALIELGDAHTLVGSHAGKLYGWGDNEYGQLGQHPIFYDSASEIDRA